MKVEKLLKNTWKYSESIKYGTDELLRKKLSQIWDFLINS